ncbi:hypothetical protein B0J12DRAFT_646636 [Macrophomina phaseolina]|uniref:Uncharacterized protein n=1 Tax=Macrophomina phaseolina TaxID=35725 RepID=A0ABQ8GN03_9PEZI|nr:hypothetical protein B0J12DRAFT_646636 [Macrophomina phaseolina]
MLQWLRLSDSFCPVVRQVDGRAWTSQFTGNLHAIIDHPTGTRSNKPITKQYEDMLYDACGYNRPFGPTSFGLPNERHSCSTSLQLQAYPPWSCHAVSTQRATEKIHCTSFPIYPPTPKLHTSVRSDVERLGFDVLLQISRCLPHQLVLHTVLWSSGMTFASQQHLRPREFLERERSRVRSPVGLQKHIRRDFFLLQHPFLRCSCRIAACFFPYPKPICWNSAPSFLFGTPASPGLHLWPQRPLWVRRERAIDSLVRSPLARIANSTPTRATTSSVHLPLIGSISYWRLLIVVE